jgi:hypothetical protein
MNNKAPLPKQRDKNNPLVPPIKIINQNILLNTDLLRGNSNTSDINTGDDDKIFDWSTFCSNKTTKQKRIYSPLGNSPKTKHTNTTFISKNKFTPLSPSNDDTMMETETQITASTTTDNTENTPHKSTSLPPLIFIKTDMKYNLFCEFIKPLIQPEGFLCKSSVNGLKLNTYTIDAYRKVVKVLKEKKGNFHTYQIR